MLKTGGHFSSENLPTMLKCSLGGPSRHLIAHTCVVSSLIYLKTWSLHKLMLIPLDVPGSKSVISLPQAKILEK